MNKENYLSLNAEDVHRRLITDIGLNMDEAPKLLEELTAADRYKEDHVFRASVETAKVYLFSRDGKSSEVIKRCGQLTEIAGILQEWELLSFDYNMMANAYFLLGLYIKALEYYYSAINNEKEHGLKNTLPVSCANIGLIFLNVGVYEKAVEYLRLALEYIDYSDKDYLKFKEKKIHILADILTAITRMDNPNPEEIEKIYNDLSQLDVEGIDINVAYTYYLGRMHYHFWKKDFDKAKEEYFYSMEFAKINHINKVVVLYSFIEECDKYKLDLEFFEKELLEAEYVEKDENSIEEPVVYTKLKKYYASKGNINKVEEVEQRYKEYLEDSVKMGRKNQAASIQVIENVLKGSDKVYVNDDKDKEFKLVAKEAIRNKDELQKTDNRKRMINEIGMKLISSTNLSEVVDLIYKNIHENIPADAFMFLEVEPEKKQLRSLLSYNMEVMSPGFTISFDRKDSALVRCCLNNEIISTEDEDFVPLLQYIDESEDGDDMRSALFIPLSIGDKVIGAYSVQSLKYKAYTPEAFDFLRELRPYLVIALNNAIHSQKLQNEIIRNKEIQAQLKEANDKLSKIAGLDALTQISNRREFTEKFHALRKEANRLGNPVSVFMFDIDDFKKYNDTYGHFAGDEALKKVAKIINNNIIASGGIAARFGGEEFISACTGLTEEENFILGDKIRKEIYALGIENIKTRSGILSISIGIAIAEPGKNITKSEIMGLADEMLYVAKKTGKNKVVVETIDYMEKDNV